jgi:uncharacterized membrane protein YedE/YeeE
MSDETAAAPKAGAGMSPSAAQRLEWGVIGLGILALALIFQPFSLTLFGAGCALVVFAGLANNLLPLCQPGTAYRSLVSAALIVALAFFVVMLVSVAAAYFYGVFFVHAIAPDTSEPFYRQPFVWGVAGIAVALAAILAALARSKANRTSAESGEAILAASGDQAKGGPNALGV